MNLRLQTNSINELKKLGYCKIENFLDQEHINEFSKEWQGILNFAIKNEISSWQSNITDRNKKLLNTDVFKKDGKWGVWKSHYILVNTEIGLRYISYINHLMEKINPNLVFLKDRIMNQGPNTKGHRPHQDTFSGRDEFFMRFTTGEIYTMYISLTNTNQDNGCIWVEELKERRSERLGYCDEGCATGKPCLCTNWEHTADKIKFWNGHIMKPMPQKKGDAVIFDGYALHGTGINMTDDTRKTLLFMYAVPKPEFSHIPKNEFWKFTSQRYNT